MKFKVQFFKGTKAQYDSISPNRYTFYFLTDTDQVFLGATQLTNTDTSSIQAQILRINQQLNNFRGNINTINGNINTINRNITGINGNISTINGNITNINSQMNEVNNEITNIDSDLNTFKQNAVSIFTVTEENKQEIESGISKKDRFYLYVYNDEQKSPDLKIGDGITQIGDLPFLCQTGSGEGNEHGIPAGGTVGQVLVKKSNTNYDVDWSSVEGVTQHYTHYQAIPLDTWTINHNMNFNPSVTVVDSVDRVVVGEVEYINLNQVVVTFQGAFSGHAYLS